MRTGSSPTIRTQTVDAIVSGCQHAQAGAVERLFRLHHRNYPELTCLLSGGGGEGARAAALRSRSDLHENLVLEGLHRIAQSQR